MPNLAAKSRFVAIALWATTACSLSCGSDDKVGGNNFNGPDLNQLEDAGADLAGDAKSDLSDTEDLSVVDASIDAKMDGGIDMEVEAECICTDPLATCDPEFGTCVRNDVDCDTASCPDGFTCITPPNGESVCICDGTYDECGPFCDENDLCPGTRLMCDTNPQGGVCRQPLECVDDFECGPDKICARDERIDRDVCMSAGPKMLGASCTERTECQSGLCVEGECSELCSVNADCENGEICTFGLLGTRPNSDGCEPGMCEVAGCDETASRCGTFGGGDAVCASKACEISGECQDGDCIIELGTRRGGTCATSVGPELPECKPGEFKAYEGDPYCRLPSPCWNSAVCQSDEVGGMCDDCPAQYECLDPGPNAPRNINTFCSRLVE